MSYNKEIMALAKSFFYEYRDVPVLPIHPDCDNVVPSKYVGNEHVYALCAICNRNWVLMANENWELLGKDQLWVGPADHGERE